jgi:hypothetical protein
VAYYITKRLEVAASDGIGIEALAVELRETFGPETYSMIATFGENLYDASLWLGVPVRFDTDEQTLYHSWASRDEGTV